MVRYLLGELNEKERIEFEEACFADDQHFEELLAVEAELTDDYVRGHLIGLRKERFERQLLSTAEGKSDVEFARIITSSSSATPWLAAPSAIRHRSLRFAWLDFRGRTFQLSLAALALILVAIGLWLFWSTRQTGLPQQRVAQQIPDRSAPPGPSPGESQAAATPEVPKQRDTPNGNTAPRREALAVVSLLLVPGFERSTGGANDLIISPATRRVRLQLAIESNKYQNYRAVLRSIEGKEIFDRQGLRARSTRSGIALTLELPAGDFREGDFILTLSGTTAQGDIEDVHKYFLTVSKK
jgi:hypothetical protein